MNFSTLAIAVGCALASAASAFAQEASGDSPTRAPAGIQFARDGFGFTLSGRLGASATLLGQQAGGTTTKSLTDNLLESSWLRLSGSADLSGGVAALFRLETGVAMDTGSAGGTGSGGRSSGTARAGSA